MHQASLQCLSNPLVSRLEEEGVDDEDGVDMLGSPAGLNQGGVVMETQALHSIQQGHRARQGVC